MIRRLSIGIALACASAIIGAQAPRQAPVFFVIVSTIDDHLHDNFSVERIERTLPVIDELRRRHPDAQASWLLRLSGGMAAHLGDTDYATHLVQRLKARLADGSVEIGYDGTEEPTFATRPRPNLRGATTPEARWLARLEAAEWFLTEAKHPVLGEPLATGTGGLARVLDVFGHVSAARGVTLELGSDAETMHAMRHLGVAALMPGLPDPASFPARTLDGVRTGTGPLSREFAPRPVDSPDLYMLDGVLRLSEYTGIGSRMPIAREGIEPLKKYLEGLDRSQPRVVQVIVGHPGVFAKLPYGPRAYETPLEYAYDRPRAPRLPDEALRNTAERDAEYAKERAALEWIAAEFLPGNPGSRFASIAYLEQLVGPPNNIDVSDRTLAQAAEIVLRDARVNNGMPPTFVLTDDTDLSLADVFLALATALSRTLPGGEVPATMGLAPIGGPLRLPVGAPPAVGATVSVESVIDACTTIASRLQTREWSRVPTNVVPSEVTVGGHVLTAPQFLVLMADVYRDHHRGRIVAVPFALALSPVAEAFPRTRPVADVGILWTLKPARLALKAPAS